MGESGKKVPGINKYLVYLHLPFTIIWLILKSIMWLKGSALLNFYDANEYVADISYETTLHGGLSVLLPICYAVFVIICSICIGKIYKCNFKNKNLINAAIAAFGSCELTELVMLWGYRLLAKELELFALFKYMNLNFNQSIIISVAGYIICLIFCKCFQSTNSL